MKKNNTKIFYGIIALISVFAVASIALAYSMTQNINVSGDYVYNEAEQPENIGDITFGGSTSPDKYQRQFFHAGYQGGGGVLATTSTAATYTLTSAEIDSDVSYISWTPNINLTLTSMASTSMYWLGINTGDWRTYDIYQASTTAASTITFAAGTGVDLQEDEAGSVILNGLEAGKIKFIRKADSDVLMIVTPFQVGD